MSAGVAGHGGLPCSRVSAGPWAAPETDVDAVNEYEHAEDENFVDMFLTTTLVLMSTSIQRIFNCLPAHLRNAAGRKPNHTPGICTPGYMGGAQYLPRLASSKYSTVTEQNLGVVDLALLSITLYTDITAPCTIT